MSHYTDAFASLTTNDKLFLTASIAKWESNYNYASANYLNNLQDPNDYFTLGIMQWAGPSCYRFLHTSQRTDIHGRSDWAKSFAELEQIMAMSFEEMSRTDRPSWNESLYFEWIEWCKKPGSELIEYSNWYWCDFQDLGHETLFAELSKLDDYLEIPIDPTNRELAGMAFALNIAHNSGYGNLPYIFARVNYGSSATEWYSAWYSLYSQFANWYRYAVGWTNRFSDLRDTLWLYTGTIESFAQLDYPDWWPDVVARTDHPTDPNDSYKPTYPDPIIEGNTRMCYLQRCGNNLALVMSGTNQQILQFVPIAGNKYVPIGTGLIDPSGSIMPTPDPSGKPENTDVPLGYVQTDPAQYSTAQRTIIETVNGSNCPVAIQGWCLQWVDDVLDFAIGPHNRLPMASDMFRAYCHSEDKSALRVGMIIAVEHSTSAWEAGHIGIYAGNGMMWENIGGVNYLAVDDFIERYNLQGTGPVRWGWAYNINLKEI